MIESNAHQIRDWPSVAVLEMLDGHHCIPHEYIHMTAGPRRHAFYQYISIQFDHGSPPSTAYFHSIRFRIDMNFLQ